MPFSLADPPCCWVCDVLQLEKAQRDPARVALLYERAVAVFPVTSELWLQYTRYLEAELKVPAVINKVGASAGTTQVLHCMRAQHAMVVGDASTYTAVLHIRL